MRLYTLQHPDAWVVAQKRGWLSGNHAFRFCHTADDYAPTVVEAYAWMRRQMARRLPDFSGEYPVWAWPERPDLRAEVWHTDEPLLMLACDVPEHRLLFTDFDAWHIVLNDGYFSWTRAEDKRVHADGEPSIERKRKSWERLFAFHRPIRRRRDVVAWNGSVKGRRQQACVDRIYVHEVIAQRLVSPHPRRKAKPGR